MCILSEAVPHCGTAVLAALKMLAIAAVVSAGVVGLIKGVYAVVSRLSR